MFDAPLVSTRPPAASGFTPPPVAAPRCRGTLVIGREETRSSLFPLGEPLCNAATTPADVTALVLDAADSAGARKEDAAGLVGVTALGVCRETLRTELEVEACLTESVSTALTSAVDCDIALAPPPRPPLARAPEGGAGTSGGFCGRCENLDNATPSASRSGHVESGFEASD